MRCCTFAGHREILERGVEKRIVEAIRDLVRQESDFCFFTGGMGEFDCMCASAVRKIKKENKDKRIYLVLVEAYMKQSINTNGLLLKKQYDEILIPTDWADCYYKKAIGFRNQWMSDHSQYMIAYVARQTGGAYASMKYAEKKGLIIRNLYLETEKSTN